MHDTAANAFPDGDLRKVLGQFARPGGLLEVQDGSGASISLSEVLALDELAAVDDLSQQDLATALGLEKSTVSRLAAGLEKRGWVTRERDESNRRFYRLRLTPDGRAAVSRISGAVRERREKLFAVMSPDEVAGLRLGIHALARAFSAGADR